MNGLNWEGYEMVIMESNCRSLVFLGETPEKQESGSSSSTTKRESDGGWTEAMICDTRRQEAVSASATVAPQSCSRAMAAAAL